MISVDITISAYVPLVRDAVKTMRMETVVNSDKESFLRVCEDLWRAYHGQTDSEA